MKPPNPSSELASILAEKIPFDMVADALFRALTATVVTRSGALEPDTRSQLQAASIILENRVGRPVNRQEIINVDLNSEASESIQERLRKSPAMRHALKRILCKAEENPQILENHS